MHKTERKFLYALEELAEPREPFLARKFKSGISHIGLAEEHSEQVVHEFVARQIQQLAAEGILSCVCLEIGDTLQKTLDKYELTGDESHLEIIAATLNGLILQGYPLEGRLAGGYFNIFRHARNKARIVAMDLDNATLLARNKHMAKLIPIEGKTLYYVGGMHLPHDPPSNGSVASLLEARGIASYTIRNIVQGNNFGFSECELNRLVSKSKRLDLSQGFAIDLWEFGLTKLAGQVLNLTKREFNFMGLIFHPKVLP